MRKISFLIVLIFVIMAGTAVFSAEPQYILIKEPGQYIRAGAFDTAKIIAKAKVGDAFRVITLKEFFFEIVLPSGEKAYVPIDVATIITVKELEDIRAERAHKQAATPGTAPEPKVQDKPAKVE